MKALKKTFLLTLLTAIIFFPPICIYLAAKTSIEFQIVLDKKQALQVFSQDLKPINTKEELIASLFNKTATRIRRFLSEALWIKKAGKYENLLRTKFAGFCESFNFPVQFEILMVEENKLKSIKGGKKLGLSEVCSKLQNKEFIQTQRPVILKNQDLASLSKQKRYFFRFLNTKKTNPTSYIIIPSEKGSKFLAVSMIKLFSEKDRDKNLAIVLVLADLTKFDKFASISNALSIQPKRKFGLGAFDKKNRKIAFSKFFSDKTDFKEFIKSSISKNKFEKTKLKFNGSQIKFFTSNSEKHIVLFSVMKNKNNFSQALQILLGLSFIFSCFLFKVLTEKILLKRGPDLNLSKLIPGIFILLILQPAFASIYIAEEFTNTSYLNTSNNTKAKLKNELRNIDNESFDNLREFINTVRGLNQFEKILNSLKLRIPENLDSYDFENFGLKFLKRHASLYPKQNFRTLWIKPKNSPMFSLKKNYSKFVTEKENNRILKIFSNRFDEILALDGSNKEIRNTKKEYNKSQLQSEVAQEFFLNILGPESFYRFRKNGEIILKTTTAYSQNFVVSIPITYKNIKSLFFTYNQDFGRSNRSLGKIPTDNISNKPRIIIYGGEKDFDLHPKGINFVSKNFPQLFGALTNSFKSKIPTSKKVDFGEFDKFIEVIPSDYSFYAIGGVELIKKYQKFRTEFGLKVVLFVSGLFLIGTLIAWSGAHFFISPIKELTMGTDEIKKGNYSIQINDFHPDEFSQISSSFNQMAQKLHEGKMLKSFVSKSVLREVSSGNENYSDKAKQSYATIIFSGIMNFKELQNNKTAVEIFDLMQKHLTVAADSVSKFGGEIDKMIEDKIMIVFEHSALEHLNLNKPVEAAIMIKKQMSDLYNIDVAIGINSGITISGVMGAEKARLAHTVVGDPVNLAARLASEALKMDKAEIVISGNMINNLSKDYIAEKLPINRVKGKTQSIEAYVLKQTRNS